MALGDPAPSPLCTQSHVRACRHAHFAKARLRCAAPQMGCKQPSYLGELCTRPAASLPLIRLCGGRREGGSPLSRSMLLDKVAWEQVPAPDLHLSVRAWGPILALCPSCCATLGRELHLSETWLLLRERGLTTSTFDGCCGIIETPRRAWHIVAAP